MEAMKGVGATGVKQRISLFMLDWTIVRRNLLPMQKLTVTLAAAAAFSLPAMAEDKWFEKMEIGPAWMNTFGDYYQGEKRVGAIKGLMVDLGEDWQALYDTETLRLSSVYKGDLDWGGTPWTGDHGKLIYLNDQDALVKTATTPGWANPDGTFADKREIEGYGNMPSGEFTGHYRHGRDIVLAYDINGASVLETIMREGDSVTRFFQIGQRESDLVLLVADEEKDFEVADDGLSAKIPEGLHVVVSDGVKLSAAADDSKRLLATFPAGDEELTAQLSFAFGQDPKVAGEVDFDKLTSGGPGIWTETLTTEGKISEADDRSYLTDVISAPEENPWNANLRFGGFDFIDEDSAALSTWNGDVWVVEGLAGDWKTLEWRRIASGLFETLGVKVVDGVIYVNGRDQITKLHDLNDDGETDYFEVFNRDVYVSSNFHEFAFDLQTDAEGNFYFSKGAPVRGGGRGFDMILPHHGVVAKISPDGEDFEVIATGLRAPGGLGVGPNGEITTGENEGTWQPACKLNFMRQADAPRFFGTEDTRQSLSDEPFTQPMVYFPMDVDNSGGSQVWVPEGVEFGLNAGDLIHLSYGQSSLYRVLPATEGDTLQGGVVKLPIALQSSAMRAKFHEDGTLYALGFRGWQTNAATSNAFQRIRYNPDVPVTVPEALEYTDNGIRITFPVELDRELAEDVTSFAVQRWDYVRGPQYGSGEFSVDEVDEELREKALTSESKNHRVRDNVIVNSAVLSEDGKTVELVLDGMKPSMSLKVSYDLEEIEGEVVNNEIHATVYKH